MNRRFRILRPVAALAVLFGASACSDIAFDAADGGADEIGDSAVDSAGDSEGDSTTDPGGSDGSDEGTSETGADDTNPEDGPGDPHLTTPMCDPLLGQVISYDLAEAHAEIAPELVRESVMTSSIVPQIPLSPRPFFNHFQFDHPPAIESTLAISGELWKPQAMVNLELPRYQLQFAVSGPEMSAEQRPPIDLAIVVDIGPSMAGLPLELTNEALDVVSESLRVGDRITLISAGDQAELISTTLIEDGAVPALDGMLVELPPASAAAIAEGLGLAYTQLAELEPLPAAQARVMLISAGHFAADPALVELVDDQAELGITLTSLGVGALDQFTDSSLQILASAGKGASVYAPNADQLWLALGDQFTAKMITSASDVEVTLILPPGLAVSERDPSWGTSPSAKLELASLGPNDSLVFHQELESCGEANLDAVIRVELEWIEPGQVDPQQLVWELPVVELGFGAMTTRKGAAVLAYTDALIAYRDGLDATARYGALLDALGHIAEALESMPDDPDLIEMSEVLAKLEST